MNKGGVESEANVTEIHEALHLDRMADTNAERIGHFGIFSICWAPNGREVAAGTGESSVLIYDMEIGKVGQTSDCWKREYRNASFGPHQEP